MESYDITAQVLNQLEYYAERIAHLQSIGDHQSAEILKRDAEEMATYADAQEEWVIVSAAD